MGTKKTSTPRPSDFRLPPVGVDTHAHLDFPQFESDLPEVLERSRQSGLRSVVNIFLGPEAYMAGRSLFEDRPEVLFALGVHPHEADQVDEQLLSRIEGSIKGDSRIRAMGEIGLDLFRRRAAEERQTRAFEEQLSLARDNDWRVIIHSREAWQQTLSILRRMGFQDRPLLWHCFSGDEDLARRVVAEGWLVSIPGILTYRNSEAMQRAVREIPMDRLVLETDCPFLSPEPYRGRRNEPAFTVFTAKALASVKGISLEEVWRRTADNAARFFGLDG